MILIRISGKQSVSELSTMIRDGMIVKEGLRSERTRVEMPLGEMMLNGEDRLEEVQEARLEESGQLSLLRKDPNKPVQKRDRKLLV